jgi:hypothetical protein
MTFNAKIFKLFCHCALTQQNYESNSKVLKMTVPLTDPWPRFPYQMDVSTYIYSHIY